VEFSDNVDQANKRTIGGLSFKSTIVVSIALQKSREYERVARSTLPQGISLYPEIHNANASIY